MTDYYVTCKNCNQIVKDTEWVCPKCHREPFLDYSKCRHNDFNELEINITESCVPNHTFTEAFCYHCCSEVDLVCHAQLGLDDIATFQRPNGSKLELLIIR